ncbi:hypothetical protein GCM10009541_01170 [Micromonospora gifhornensis]|uniref:DUF1996 domain-containing protein n=1 Tax=Micromonospora gifhornensis TaxID=84594 RepID=A0ABQ4ILG1_9ACTN|nr:DUF1996 domain-containing protein [Micromonospora gifhornensis]GIJ18543.1 hypothetical protein Vgi01_52270 [Micromonospora gifhornensis]
MSKAGMARRRAYALVMTLEMALIGAGLGLVAGCGVNLGGAPAGTGIAARLGADFVDIDAVPPNLTQPVPAVGAATGSYTWDCGRNENGHRNTVNVVSAPGYPGPAHHVHDYVGNLSTDVDSTIESLADGETSCRNGDLSTYFWPVLRLVDEEPADGHDGPTGGYDGPTDGHGGRIQVPSAFTLTYRGNPQGNVVPMPRLLRGTVGDAAAITNGGARARATWTCDSTPDRRTTSYPVCPPGDQVVRIHDFPSCWDGRHLDTPDHRAHLVFPTVDGGCPKGTFPVPQLRLVAAYDLPTGKRFQIDAFDGQRNSPLTDHAFFVNLMPDELMARVVGCLNSGRTCVDEQSAASGPALRS